MKRQLWKLRHRIKHLQRDFFSLFDEYGDADVDPIDALWQSPSIGYKVDVKLTLTLTNDDIESIMHTALKDDVSYWCKNVDLAAGWMDRHLHEQVPRYGTLCFCDVENKSHDLTLEKLLDGLRLFYINGGNVKRTADGRIDVRDIGKPEADAIIQYALFGKIHYDGGGQRMWHEGVIGVPSEDGTYTKIHYWVKAYDEPSKIFGIDGGRISKLSLKQNGESVANYDRGWDKRPATPEAEAACMILLKEYN